MSLKHSVYRTVSRALRAAGTDGAPPPGLRVLLYHSVGTAAGPDPFGTVMAPALFGAHVAALAALRAELPPAPFAAPADAAPRLAVTFDDGYRDTLTAAAPLLAAHGIPFTVFVPPEHLDAAGSLYLDKAALRELACVPGASIGAHGARHVPLTRLDDAELEAEMAASRKRLEDALGRPVDSMSYPFGLVDRRVAAAAAAAGFTLAGTSVYGTNLPGADPLLLRRTEAVAWDTPDDLRLKLFGHWDWFRLRQSEARR
ncbi:MAG: polysaccharide deacetylase family protein [Elusimicrobia bacterium]|nr:polysaccharide deacetylase family protein [Elusimicrobiota bacterium]